MACVAPVRCLPVIDHASDEFAVPHDAFSRPPFLGSHRAVSVANREFTRLSSAAVASAQRVAALAGQPAPTMRCSPDRCIVQVGPVALSVAYLRTGADLPPGGELLAIVWRGIIAPRGDHVPERLGARPIAVQPSPLWEATIRVSADDEQSWHWHLDGLDRAGCSSPELADRLAQRLEDALRQELLPLA